MFIYVSRLYWNFICMVTVPVLTDSLRRRHHSHPCHLVLVMVVGVVVVGATTIVTNILYASKRMDALQFIFFTFSLSLPDSISLFVRK